MSNNKSSLWIRYGWLVFALTVTGFSFSALSRGVSSFNLPQAPKLLPAIDLKKDTGFFPNALPAIPATFTDPIAPSMFAPMQQPAGCGASFTQATGSPVSVGTAPRAVAVGDFNLDGKPDMAVANSSSNNVTVMLGNGSGAFTQAANSPIGVGTAPYSVATADFNLDGKPDLAVTNNGSNNLTILLGNGIGGFAQAAGSPVTVGSSPRFVAIGDFNLDGKPDLAVANFLSNNVAILLGNGSGGFALAAIPLVNVGSGPVFVVAGDFNLDGKLDLAVANSNSGNVTILLGNGSSGFAQAAGSPIVTGGGPASIAVGDFNLDGKPDLAVANAGSGSLSILQGNGSGGFVRLPISLGGNPSSVAIGDFTLDGKPDLAVANSATNIVAILQGDGSGGFTSAAGSPTAAGTAPNFLAVGDFNLDGKPDFAVANQNSNNVTIQLNTCPALPCSGIAFSEATRSPINVGVWPNSQAVGDFNLDGKLDLAVANFNTSSQNLDRLTILLGNGNGEFMQSVGSPISVGNAIVSVASGDFNLDGKPDLVVANFFSDDMNILLGNGNGGFTQAAASPVSVGSNPSDVIVGDFNLDGKFDLAVTNSNSNNLTVLLGDGLGGFTESVGSPFATGRAPQSVVTRDFNLDGKPDLAIANAFRNVTVLLGNGTGTFIQAAGSPVNANFFPYSIVADDLNLDGKLDLAVANRFSNDVTILIGIGNGSFVQPIGSPVTLGENTNPSSASTGDFNLDGKPDLAISNETSSDVRILLGNGSGGFTLQPNSLMSSGLYPRSLATGDFNLDGKVDFAITNIDSSNVTILLNNCTTPSTPPTITCPANIMLGSAAGQSSASVPFTVTAIGFPPPTITCRTGNIVITSPHVFPVGTTAVNCTASNGVAPDATCSFTVTVNRVSGSVNDPLICTGPGGKVQATLNISNDGQVNQNVVSNTTFTNLIGIPGSCVVTPNVGTCTVTAGGVSYSGTLTPGVTATITYLTQVSDSVLPGAQVCTNNSVSFNGGQPTTFSVCDVVDCPAIGPGGAFPAVSESSDQKAGSVLVYNVYTSSTDPIRQNTRINLTNTHSQLPAFVHLFFVSEGCSVADSYLCLTPNQTTSFLASDLDPGVSGYLVAVAVDARGCPTNFNYLIGDEYVKFSSGHAANLGAQAFSALVGGLPVCDGNSVTAQLNFDGISYNRLPAVLALSNVGSRADGNDTLLVVNRIGGNLGIGAATLGSLFGILYDDAENALSFSVAGGCQLRNSLTNNFPRTTPRFETFIPAGRTGWLKLYNQTGAVGLTGAAINFNPNTASSAGAFNQGHNLHALTLNATNNFVIPVFPPSC